MFDTIRRQLEGSGIGSVPGVSYLEDFALRANRGVIDCRGFKMQTIRTNDGWLYYPDNFESNTIECFGDLVTENSLVVDVGASLGYYSLEAWNITDGGASVLSFEPDPERLSPFVKSLEINGCESVKACQLAAWDKTSIPDGTVRVDDLLSTPPDVVKIDCEGAEVRALSGMTGCLGENTSIILEYHPEYIGDFGTSHSELTELISNFEVFEITSDGLEAHETLPNRRSRWLLTR